MHGQHAHLQPQPSPNLAFAACPPMRESLWHCFEDQHVASLLSSSIYRPVGLQHVAAKSLFRIAESNFLPPQKFVWVMSGGKEHCWHSSFHKSDYRSPVHARLHRHNHDFMFFRFVLLYLHMFSDMFTPLFVLSSVPSLMTFLEYL